MVRSVRSSQLLRDAAQARQETAEIQARTEASRREGDRLRTRTQQLQAENALRPKFSGTSSFVQRAPQPPQVSKLPQLQGLGEAMNQKIRSNPVFAQLQQLSDAARAGRTTPEQMQQMSQLNQQLQQYQRSLPEFAAINQMQQQMQPQMAPPQFQQPFQTQAQLPQPFQTQAQLPQPFQTQAQLPQPPQQGGGLQSLFGAMGPAASGYSPMPAFGFGQPQGGFGQPQGGFGQPQGNFGGFGGGFGP